MRGALRLLLVCLAAFAGTATAAPLREPAGRATGAAPPGVQAEVSARPGRSGAVQARVVSRPAIAPAEVPPRGRRFLWHRALLR